MNLSVHERFVLMSILPSEGNFVTLTLMEELKRALSFSDKEVKDFEIVATDGRTSWEQDKAQNKDVTVGDAMAVVIISKLKEMDAAHKLTNEHLSIYEKFVNG